jgi:hypothetical protein
VLSAVAELLLLLLWLFAAAATAAAALGSADSVDAAAAAAAAAVVVDEVDGVEAFSSCCCCCGVLLGLGFMMPCCKAKSNTGLFFVPWNQVAPSSTGRPDIGSYSSNSPADNKQTNK